jgi:hypothetical protein
MTDQQGLRYNLFGNAGLLFVVDVEQVVNIATVATTTLLPTSILVQASD